MTRRLPPLNQLRAFEAAARHLSFKAAAQELSVTQAAVSQQIRSLEETLGKQLFLRGTRGVTLTDAAAALSVDLTRALDIVAGGLRRFEASGMTGKLHISVAPWYGNRIFLPGLPAFREANPGLEVELSFTYDAVDLSEPDVDAAVRHGYGSWPELEAVRVHHDRVSPTCSPRLVEGRTLPLAPEEIIEMDLAIGRGHEAHWINWFIEAGLPEDVSLNFVVFENAHLPMEFALAGNGVTLTDLAALSVELRIGHLVRLHPDVLTLESGMHLVWPASSYPDPRLAVIADWLMGLFADPA